MLQWYNWLVEMKKKDEEKRMEVEQQKLFSRMIKSAGGRTGHVHKITKPTAWRGGVQMLKDEEEDGQPSARCEEKKKEWAKHWQCDTKVQDLNDHPWRHEELKSLEKAAKSDKAETGVWCDGFHPKVPLDLTKETREVVEFLEKVEQCGRWPQQAYTTMFFLVPKNVTSERLITLLPSMLRSARGHEKATKISC